jgi:transcriptional regulator with XRE-family HTH domain
LQRYLRAEGISQAELGRRVGVTNSHISRLMSGRRDASREIIEHVIRAIGLPELPANQLRLAYGFSPAINFDDPIVFRLYEAMTQAAETELADDDRRVLNFQVDALIALIDRAGRREETDLKPYGGNDEDVADS